MKNKIIGGGWGGLLIILTIILTIPHNVNAQTPEPPSNVICPSEPPDPNQTLSLEYYQECSVCVPGNVSLVTPLPFGTFGPSPTPTLFVTTTPTITPTPIMENKSNVTTAEISIGGLAFELAIPGEQYESMATNVGYTYPMNNTLFVDGNVGLNQYYEFSFLAYYQATLPARNIFSNLRKLVVEYHNSQCDLMEIDLNLDNIYEIKLTKTQSYTDDLLVADHYSVWNINNSYMSNVKVTGSCNANNDVSIHYDIEKSYSTGNNLDLKATWWQEPFQFITATPTPSVTPIDCSVYDYVDTEETLVDFGGIEMWPGECVVIIPEFQIDLPAVGEDIPAVNWGVPGMSICPTWVDLGTFEIIEMPLPMDILALPAVMFLLTLIFAL